MPLRRKRKSKWVAPTTVVFTQAVNKAGDKKPAVYAQCHYGGRHVGPFWGHDRASVNRCLAVLTVRCDCGRIAHKCKRTEGVRVNTRPTA